MKIRHWRALLSVAICVTISVPASSDEKLTPTEYADRFVYRYFLEMLNIEQDMTQTEFSSKLFGHFGASGELAMLTLDRSSSKEAHRALAYLTLINLIGTYGQDHSDALLRKGMAMQPYLLEARRASDAGRCVLEEEFEIKMNPIYCRSKEEAKKVIDCFIETIKDNNCSQ